MIDKVIHFPNQGDYGLNREISLLNEDAAANKTQAVFTRAQNILKNYRLSEPLHQSLVETVRQFQPARAEFKEVLDPDAAFDRSIQIYKWAEAVYIEDQEEAEVLFQSLTPEDRFQLSQHTEKCGGIFNRIFKSESDKVAALRGADGYATHLTRPYHAVIYHDLPDVLEAISMMNS
ncbi:MAG: hypothetical protein MRY21_03660 [Simkaniaceae bacterium]|nr:hypothetical protein [Simkaniaceae bacterium]